ncbi:hypothetical protein [Vibrio maerlii]|nr:hypothetical protein [Vibrio maerlii]
MWSKHGALHSDKTSRGTPDTGSELLQLFLLTALVFNKYNLKIHSPDLHI